MLTSEIIIVAPEGTFIPNDKTRPTNAPINPTNIDITTIWLNFFVKILASVGGLVSNDINRIMPTIRMLSTMVKAMNPFKI